MPIAQGLVVSEDADNVVEVLTTSDEAFSKAAGYDLATYEKEDGDTEWPSLNYNYLSISGSTATLLKVLMFGGFPLAYLGIGTAVILKRRRAQHEAD